MCVNTVLCGINFLTLMGLPLVVTTDKQRKFRRLFIQLLRIALHVGVLLIMYVSGDFGKQINKKNVPSGVATLLCITVICNLPSPQTRDVLSNCPK